MQILGIDICKGKIVACLLTNRPNNPRQTYHTYDFFHIKNDGEGVALLKKLSPDVAIAEPTGIKYLKFWERWLQNIGCELWLISNQALAPYRSFLDLPDKDDEADSLALACYWFDYHSNPRRFLSRRDPIASEIRELAMRRLSYEKDVTKYTNIIHQDLEDEFPEVCNVRSSRKILKPPPLFWRWLAGEDSTKSENYNLLYETTYGKGLSIHTEFNANLVLLIGEHQRLMESRIQQLLALPQFERYLLAAKDLELGLLTSAIVIPQIYPIEKFYGENGLPEIITVIGKESGKPQTYNLTLRRVRKILGMANSKKWSGKKRGYSKSGNTIAKVALWQWFMARISPKHSLPQTPICLRLREIYEKEKIAGTPFGKIGRKISRLAVEHLFKKLTE